MCGARPGPPRRRCAAASPTSATSSEGGTTMAPFDKLTAVAAPIDLPNIDTDQIAPARFLRRPRDEGYADILFPDVRTTQDGAPTPDFVLNKPSSEEPTSELPSLMRTSYAASCS